MKIEILLLDSNILFIDIQMINSKDDITIKLTGEGISPEKVSAVDLAESIASFERALIPIIQKNEPNTSLDADSVIISLINISKGSVALAFHSDLPSIKPAFTEISSAIATNDTGILPDASRESLKNIRKLTKKRNFNVEFCLGDSILAKITPLTKIVESENIYVEGETTLYGTIKRVGGEEPTVLIQLIDGNRLICKISKKLATKFGNLLYTQVGLIGIAKWNIADHSIEEFKITEITDYQKTPLPEAFSLLSREIGYYYKDVDPIDFVSKFRGDKD